MFASDSDETNWLYLARKTQWRALLGNLPSVHRKGSTLVIGVNRAAGCFGIGTLVFTVVFGAFIYLQYLQDPHDSNAHEFFAHWFIIGGGIGLIGCVAGFSRTGLYWEDGDTCLTIRYGLFQKGRRFALSDLSANLIMSEETLWASLPRGYVLLVLHHKKFSSELSLAFARRRDGLTLAMDALAEILRTPHIGRMTAVPETRDEEEPTIPRTSCSSGSAYHRTHIFRELSPYEAVFRPTLRAYLTCGLMFAVAFGALGLMLPTAFLQGSISGVAVCAVVGYIFLRAGQAFLPRKISIGVYRSVGIVSITGLRKDSETANARTSIQDIAAVQICTRREDVSTGSHTAHELNLVLKKPSVQRINLLCHSNQRALFADAQRLADFLGKPLLDHSEEDGYRKM